MSISPRYKLGLDGHFTVAASAGTLDGANFGAPPQGSYPHGPPPIRYVFARPRDAVSDTLRDLPLKRGDSRNLARTNAIAAGAIQTNVDRVVGTGLALVAQPDRRVLKWSADQAAEWKETVQREYSLFADSADCDIRGEQNFYDKQALTERASLESGDCFTVLPDGKPRSWMPYRLRLQTIEADRCGNPDSALDSPTVAGGVRRDPLTGEALAYHIYQEHPGADYPLRSASLGAGVWINRVGTTGRKRILHHFRQIRPEQPRGIPYLSPIAKLLDKLNQYTDAEIEAAVQTANLVLAIETPTGADAARVFGATDEDLELADQAGESPAIRMAPGATIGLAPGEKATLLNPLRPNSAYEPFILSILKQVGVGLGIPFELLIKQFQASYSASKAALLDAWMRFRAERVWLARSMCQPVYETWLAEAVSIGRVPAPGFFQDPLIRWAYCQAAWFGDSQGSINPKDEVAAYVGAIEARLCSRERAEWELFGTDWNTTFPGKQAEQERLKAAKLLPVPKAGAPAPETDKGTGDGSADGGAGPGAVFTGELLSTEAQAPSITINVAPPSVTVEAPQIHIAQGDTAIHLPESQINVEAVIEQPDVHVQAGAVHVETPAPQVIVQQAPGPKTQTIRRNEAGDIVAIETTPADPSPSQDDTKDRHG